MAIHCSIAVVVVVVESVDAGKAVKKNGTFKAFPFPFLY